MAADTDNKTIAFMVDQFHPISSVEFNLDALCPIRMKSLNFQKEMW